MMATEEITIQGARRTIQSAQRKDLIATVLRNSAHANLSIATCGLLSNAIHAAAVAPVEALNAELVEALRPFANQSVNHFEQGHAETPNECQTCGPILRARAALRLAE